MRSGWFRPVLALILVMAVGLLFVAALEQLNAGGAEAGRKQLEDALRRATAACYAAEGFYPPSVDYLQTHYGVQIDESRYIVFYEVFGENLMPEITVLLKES